MVAYLTHWGRVTHICVSKQTSIGSDNGLSPGRRQAIIWTNAGVSSIGPLGANFSENLNEILTFSFKKMRLKVSSAKWRPFCLGLNVLSNKYGLVISAHAYGYGYIASGLEGGTGGKYNRSDVTMYINSEPIYYTVSTTHWGLWPLL